jgi:hypothetical protein
LLATQLSPAIIINQVKHTLKVQDLFAVMVKTVSPTLVPSDDLLLYMVYVALVITVSPICLELWNMVSFLLDSDLVCHAIGDNCIANKS